MWERIGPCFHILYFGNIILRYGLASKGLLEFDFERREEEDAKAILGQTDTPESTTHPADQADRDTRVQMASCVYLT